MLISLADVASAAFAAVAIPSAFSITFLYVSILAKSCLLAVFPSSAASSALILAILASNSGKAASLAPLYLVASSAELAAVVSTALNPLSPCPGIA